MSSSCPHVCIVGDYSQEDIAKKQQQSKCDSCEATGPNLWACLHYDCLYVGCGDGQADHSTKHFEENPTHSLTLNLLTLRVWCYQCEWEVFLENNDPPSPGIPAQAVHISSNLVTAAEPDVNDDDDDDDMQNFKPRGLTGLQNLGNTCYMNAALQALSNCPQLTQFFLDCGCYVRSDAKPGLSKSYMKLISEVWHKQRPSYVVPSGISHGIKAIFPVFRGYSQQDAQEFLRCFMDQLHEELKEPIPDSDSDSESGCSMENSVQNNQETATTDRANDGFEGRCGKKELAEVPPDDSSQSEAEFETCDSGLSSEKSSYSGEFVDQEPMEETEFLASTIKDNQSSQQSPKTATSQQTIEDSDEGIKIANGNSSTASLDSPNERRDRLLPANKPGDRTNAPYRFSSSLSPVAVGNKPSGNCNRSGSKGKRKKLTTFRSIISDIFDGKIISSVQCLTCDTVSISTTREAFQDLSLPIPSRDHLHLLHSTHGGLINLQKSNSASQSSLMTTGGTCSDGYNHQSWLQWMFGWMFNWFWGPTISLQDCLSAFFSADELKGDNMYSCDKCKKLRNGIKYSKVLQLPEVLCIHLKRFRHEVMFSSKISNFVTFPLDGLDMSMFLHKDCPRGVTTYDLIAVICHHGTAGSGHYTAYSLNHLNDQWYEFDDQYVTAVDPQVVQNCEAYVLFYRKSCDEIIKKRQLAVELMERSKSEPGLLQFFISKQWVNRFNTFAEPGPITNTDFLCSHGGVHPSKANYVEDLCTMLSQAVWEYLHDTFGGGPPCNHLFICPTCQGEQEIMERRQKIEHDTFVMLNKEYQGQDSPQAVYALSLHWFKQWELFVKGKSNDPAGPIDNSTICFVKNGQNALRAGSDYGSISDSMWRFLYNIYGGGPEIVLQKSTQPAPSSNQSVPAAVQQSALASLHTSGRASAATSLSGINHVRERSPSVARDSPCGSVASSYKGSSASSLNPLTNE